MADGRGSYCGRAQILRLGTSGPLPLSVALERSNFTASDHRDARGRATAGLEPDFSHVSTTSTAAPHVPGARNDMKPAVHAALTYWKPMFMAYGVPAQP